MSGNASEEGVLLDIKNPAHRNRMPAAIAVMLLVWAIGVAIVYSPDFTPLLKWLLASVFFVLGILAGTFGWRWPGRQLSGDAPGRSQRVRESRRAIESARAAGDFDRWEKT